MLKSSPVLTGSSNASPSNFRHAHILPHTHANPHAHAPASDSTTAAVAGPVRRRLSLLSAPSPNVDANAHISMKSPAAPRSERNITHEGASIIETSPAARGPPPSPRPQPMAKSSTATTPSGQPQASLAAPDAQRQTILSPNKRRGSPSHLVGQNASTQTGTASGTPSPKASKRTKPEESPPKVLPNSYEFCQVADVVELISHMLAELIATNDAIRISNGGLTRFHSRTAPGISVRDYLHRLARHATLTPPLLLAMVYYIDRLCLMYQEFTINTLTVHRFLITAATVASKGLSDSFWNNATYARVGGVRVAELKLLELEFLHRVDWKIVPNPEVLVAYYKGLVERTPGYALESDGDSDEDVIDEDNEEQVERPN